MLARHRLLVSLTLVLSLTALAARTSAAGPIVLPGQDEELQNRRRAAWIEQIHRAAPGTEWRTIEAANREQSRLLLDGLGRAGVNAASWSETGADGTTGRTGCVALSSVDAGRLYVGTALGGVWSGDLAGGPAWTPLTDALGIGVQQLVVVPQPGRDDFVIADGGSRILFTANGGASWSAPAGLPSPFWNARRLVQDAAAPTRLFALIDNWYWTGSSWEVRTRVLRSENAGASFVTLREDPASAGVDLWMDRLAGGAVWLLTGNVLRRSLDHGATFTVISTVPGAAAAGASLAGSEAGAPKLYAALYSGGAWHLYSSANAGASWQAHAAPGDCWGMMSASLTDSAQVFMGGVDLYRSFNGGATFQLVNSWVDYYGDPEHRLHADMRGIDCLIVPTGPSSYGERVYVSTDGGTYRLDLAGLSSQNLTLNGLRNAQYYGVRTSGSNRSRIAAGSQDQGYQTTTSAPSFVQQISGDYGHLTGSLPSNDMVWSVYPGFMLLQITEDPVTLEAPYPATNFPSDPNLQWMPAILAEPGDPSSVLLGGRWLWRVTRTAPLAYAHTPLWDFDGGSGDGVGAVAIAASDPQRWYVATTQGRLYFSTDGGATFAASGSPGPGSHYFYGSDLLVSPTDPLLAYVGGSGYSNAAVYRTTDGGMTWSPYGLAMPATLVHGLAFDDPVHQTVYAASDAGPLRCQGGVWQNLLTAVPGAPLTEYWDVESIPDQGIVRFATYGRGLWDFHTDATTAVGTEPRAGALRFEIGPNPSRESVRFAWEQAAAGRVRIDVFDVSGRIVATPFERECPAGAGEARFDGTDPSGRPLPRGIYLVRLQTREGREVRQMVRAR